MKIFPNRGWLRRTLIPSGKARGAPTPEDVRAANEDQETVRVVLSLAA